ncbi:hypothetical protein N7452_011090 [Penicillium brevicompactum]|uniref:Uncharacterized protein n=1 Tax=Penicillium brevicompactum TaxID=5074 RepID=A0A9W9U6I9_PENBR|nr:hypothetical protein N7452_011090 [Penicillium brevicompactum]
MREQPLPAIHPSFIQVANPYIFEQTVESCIESMGVKPPRETSSRLQGVAWLDEDAAAAALFTACKIEDTLKKSRDIVCAAYNLKVSPSEQLSADDPMFETNARGIIGLERLMLEASGFDFRTRHPQKTLMKLSRHYGLPRDSEVANLAYRISTDLYRTFAPIKQGSSAMAFGCLELAGRLLDQRAQQVESGQDYAQWNTTRAEVMDRFLTVRIPLNQEASEQHIPRYNVWVDRPQKPSNGSGGLHDSHRIAHPLTPIAANGESQKTSERGRDAAVRFMLDPACADEEKREVARYFDVEMEEYEAEH